VAVLAAVLTGTLWVGGRALGGSASGPPADRRYVVRQGDTLWEIARGLVGSRGDPRPAVEAIREVNGLGTGPLPAGDTLALPGP
jgi:hypothetical protein